MITRRESWGLSSTAKNVRIKKKKRNELGAVLSQTCYTRCCAPDFSFIKWSDENIQELDGGDVFTRL